MDEKRKIRREKIGETKSHKKPSITNLKPEKKQKKENKTEN